MGITPPCSLSIQTFSDWPNPAIVEQIQTTSHMNPRVTRIITRIVAVIIGLIVLLRNFQPVPLTATLDSSWTAVITYAAAKPLEFGSDIVFTYGPLGHLVAAFYSPKLFVPDLIANAAIDAFYIILLILLSSKLGPTRRLLFFLSSFLMAFYSIQGMYLFMLVGVGWLVFAVPRPNPALFISALSFAAMAALIKATFLSVALFVVILGVVHLILRQKVKRALLAAGSFIAVFLAAWLICGQKVSNIPSYLFTSFEIVRGYSPSMSVAPGKMILAAGIAGFLFSALQIAAAFVRNRSDSTALFMALTQFAALFLAWKLGYSRADLHTTEFFYYGSMAVLALPIFYSQPLGGRSRGFDYAAILVMTTCGFLVIQDQTPKSVATICQDIGGRLALNVTALRHPGTAQKNCENVLQRDSQKLDLPLIRQAIGRATVDVFGYEAAVAIANDFNYTPRPVFTGYDAYTPALIKLNSDFYRSARAPEYVIFKLQTIDAHIPALDDAETLVFIAQNYRPILTENGYTLLKRREAAFNINDQPKASHAGESTIGQSIPVPQGAIWCQLSLHANLLGKLKGFLYQPTKIWVQLESRWGQLPVRRILLMPAANGFLINPLLQSDRDFQEFVNENYQNLEIETIKIVPTAGTKWLMHQSIRYRFSEIPMPDTQMISHSVRRLDAAGLIRGHG
jgi:hypothetical protein